MKKISVIVLVIVLLLTFAACDPIEFYFDYDELKENVTRVELIYYNNPDAKELFDQRDKVLPFDFSKMEILEILPEKEVDGFLHDLSEHPFMMDWKHLDSPKGYCIRILYKNGDFEIMTSSARGELDDFQVYSGGFYADGQVRRFIGMGLSTKIFDKYFEIN